MKIMHRLALIVCLRNSDQPAAQAADAREFPPPWRKWRRRRSRRDILRAPIRFLASDELEGRGPATRGDALARLYLASQLESLGFQPGGENGSWEQTVDVVGVTAKLPATWDFTGKGGDVVAQVVRGLHRGQRRAGADRGDQGRRPGVRGLRHRSARVQVERFQGRRRARQGAGDAQQRSGLGSEVVRRQDAPVLRPLDLQVRKRRASWRGRRDHRAHHAVGGLSMAGGAVVVGRRAVRIAGRGRAAHPAQGLGHRRRRAPPGARRAGPTSTSWSKPRRSAISSRCRSTCAPRSGSRTRSRACAPPTSRACCRAAIRSSRTKW